MVELVATPDDRGRCSLPQLVPDRNGGRRAEPNLASGRAPGQRVPAAPARRSAALFPVEPTVAFLRGCREPEAPTRVLHARQHLPVVVLGLHPANDPPPLTLVTNLEEGAGTSSGESGGRAAAAGNCSGSSTDGGCLRRPQHWGSGRACRSRRRRPPRPQRRRLSSSPTGTPPPSPAAGAGRISRWWGRRTEVEGQTQVG
jgi:hypothetical protein